MKRRYWEWAGFFLAGTFFGGTVLGGIGRLFGRR